MGKNSEWNDTQIMEQRSVDLDIIFVNANIITFLVFLCMSLISTRFWSPSSELGWRSWHCDWETLNCKICEYNQGESGSRKIWTRSCDPRNQWADKPWSGELEKCERERERKENAPSSWPGVPTPRTVAWECTYVHFCLCIIIPLVRSFFSTSIVKFRSIISNIFEYRNENGKKLLQLVKIQLLHVFFFQIACTITKRGCSDSTKQW